MSVEAKKNGPLWTVSDVDLERVRGIETMWKAILAASCRSEAARSYPQSYPNEALIGPGENNHPAVSSAIEVIHTAAGCMNEASISLPKACTRSKTVPNEFNR